MIVTMVLGCEGAVASSARGCGGGRGSVAGLKPSLRWYTERLPDAVVGAAWRRWQGLFASSSEDQLKLLIFLQPS